MFFCNLYFAISRCKSKKKNREYLNIHHFFIIFIYSAFIHRLFYPQIITDYFIHRLFLSTDYHRLFLIHRLFCPQIITDFHRLLNIKDILIITDFILHLKCILHSSFFWHGNPRLFQSHGLAPHRNNPRHFVVTACLRKFAA